MAKTIAIYALSNALNLEDCCQNAKFWGVNTLILSPDLLNDPDNFELVKSYGLKIWLNVSIFNAPEYLKRKPEHFAISNKGHIAKTSWCQFVCPSQSGYIDKLVSDLKSWLEADQVSYISLDFLRHYLFWQDQPYELINADDIEYGCFCNLCLNRFIQETEQNIAITDVTSETQVKLQYQAWRIELITQTAKKLYNEIKTIAPKSEIILNTMPWKYDEFNSALEKFGGQKLDTLANYFDAICPIAFSHITPQEASEKAALMEYYHSISDKKIYYGLQVDHWRLKFDIPNNQFETELKRNIVEAKDGMVIYNYKHLVENEEKARILKRHLNPEIHF
ncbi:hypothetical protein [Catenovulum maritimum]|uniref:DUF4015 domain-containing protein n=1 Tax=Catenovulum maritimum TaxID=1513271 RepID=A0A0J8GYX3_9ALTE|nr:hypothetical protein [Catenovulum maritimum]KMT66444.1 hypothetical protein XM47_02555 [Catenovulum maritimum]